MGTAAGLTGTAEHGETVLKVAMCTGMKWYVLQTEGEEVDQTVYPACSASGECGTDQFCATNCHNQAAGCARQENVCQPCDECHNGGDEVDGECPDGCGSGAEPGDDDDWGNKCDGSSGYHYGECETCCNEWHNDDPAKAECETRCSDCEARCEGFESDASDCCEWHDDDTCRLPLSFGDGDCPF